MEEEIARVNQRFGRILEAIEATASISDPAEENAEHNRRLDMLNEQRA